MCDWTLSHIFVVVLYSLTSGCGAFKVDLYHCLHLVVQLIREPWVPVQKLFGTTPGYRITWLWVGNWI